MTENGKLEYDISYLQQEMEKVETEIDYYRLMLQINNTKLENKIEFYLKFHSAFLNRIDVCYYLAKTYRQEKNYYQSYYYLKKAFQLMENYEDNTEVKVCLKDDPQEIKMSSRIVDFDLFDEMSIVCYYLNKKEEGVDAIEKMYERCSLSVNNQLYLDHYERIHDNYNYLMTLE
jgi:tetratricopeptide (TPR) repeat protein